MALNQMQTIQSLGNNLAMLQEEVEIFDVQATELRHLVGRIGELYACVVTNGQMALNTNEKGYDVVSNQGERISVKTTASSVNNGGVKFNLNTIDRVDRVMILKINDDLEIELLFDDSIEEASSLMTNGTIAYSKLISTSRSEFSLENIPVIKEALFNDYALFEYENGSILVQENGIQISPVKPVLREMADKLNIPVNNNNGNQHTTRSLGSLVINEILGRRDPE